MSCEFGYQDCCGFEASRLKVPKSATNGPLTDADPRGSDVKLHVLGKSTISDFFHRWDFGKLNFHWGRVLRRTPWISAFGVFDTAALLRQRCREQVPFWPGSCLSLLAAKRSCLKLEPFVLFGATNLSGDFKFTNLIRRGLEAIEILANLSGRVWEEQYSVAVCRFGL